MEEVAPGAVLTGLNEDFQPRRGEGRAATT